MCRINSRAKRCHLVCGVAIPGKVLSALQLPLSKHLARYLSEKEKECTSFDSVRNIESRLKILFNECRWKKITDIDSFEFVQWRARSKRSPKTLNEYLSDASGFIKWLNRHGFLDVHPLSDIERLRTAGRQVRARRAFSIDEFNQLLAHTPDVSRRMIYITAFYTGLRKNEISQLRWGDINYQLENPYIAARAKTTKNKKTANIPLVPIVAEAFRNYYDGQDLGETVFVMPCHKTLDRDLKAAGIPKVDSEEKHLDFHSLRHSFGTMLATSGVSQRLAQALMRHSDPKLTANVYVDAGKLLLGDAVAQLPIAEGVYQTVSKTGSTPGITSPREGLKALTGFNTNPMNKGPKVHLRVLEGGRQTGAPVRSRT